MIATLLRPRGPTGVQTHFSELYRYLVSARHPVILLTPFSAGGLVRDLTFAVRKLIDPLFPAASVRWYNHFHRVFLERALRRHLATVDRAIVYCQCPISAEAALRARRHTSQRVVLAEHFYVSQADEWVQKGRITSHGAAFRRIRRREREVLTDVDAVTFVSSSARSALWMPLPAHVPTETFPNFIAAPTNAPSRSRLLPEPADLITIGTLEPNKNHGFLLKALAAAKRRGHRYSLDIVGTGPERPTLLHKAHALGIADQVQLVGQVPNARRLIPGHRAYVHSAKRESFGIALIEAMAAGLPVIAAPVSAVPEILHPSVEGRFWSLDDPETAARTLIDLLSDEPVRARMGQAARSRFLREFDAAVVCPSLLQFLLRAGETKDPPVAEPTRVGADGARVHSAPRHARDAPAVRAPSSTCD